MKKILTVFAVLLLLANVAGCSCNGNINPTPTPMATRSPSAGGSPSASGGLTDPMQQPSGSPSSEPSTSPDAGGTGSTAIPEFKEGTEVEISELPEVKKAVEDKYPGAAIKTVKHAMQSNLQVYAVEITVSGNEQTVYVRPDGTLLDSASSPAA